MIQERENVRTTQSAPTAITVGPCPTIFQSREGEKKKEMIDERKKCPITPTRTYCKPYYFTLFIKQEKKPQVELFAKKNEVFTELDNICPLEVFTELDDNMCSLSYDNFLTQRVYFPHPFLQAYFVGWMDGRIARFYVLFKSISVILGRLAGDNERVCAMEPRLYFVGNTFFPVNSLPHTNLHPISSPCNLMVIIYMICYPPHKVKQFPYTSHA